MHDSTDHALAHPIRAGEPPAEDAGDAAPSERLKEPFTLFSHSWICSITNQSLESQEGKFANVDKDLRRL